MQCSNELQHHGVQGQKWGVRRYQNKDGSLTPAGKRRLSKIESQYEKVTGKKMGEQSSSESTPKKKTIRDLSDDELRDVNNRLNAEVMYYSNQKRLRELNPPKVSLGKKILNSVAKDVIAPAAISAGKSVLQKTLSSLGDAKMTDVLKTYGIEYGDKKKDKSKKDD